jgi:hypothetical protein
MKCKGIESGGLFSPNLFGAHRYTTVGGMCALREVLQTAVAYRGQAKGEMTFPLRCKRRTYPFVYFVPMSIPKSGILMETKSESTIPPRYRHIQIVKSEVLSWLRKN